MGNCSDKKTFDRATLEALMRIPAFRYMKAPVDNVYQLYERYPSGNEKYTFAFVYNESTFYFYKPPTATVDAKWEPISSGISSLFEIPDTSLLVDGDSFVWDSEKGKFVVINMNYGGIIFRDIEVQSVGDLSTVENPQDRWGVYVINESKYYQYDGRTRTWGRTPYEHIPEDVVLHEEIVDSLVSIAANKPLSANQGRNLNEKKQESKPDGETSLINTTGVLDDKYMPAYTKGNQNRGTVINDEGEIQSAIEEYNGVLIGALNPEDVPEGYYFVVGADVQITIGGFTALSGDWIISNGPAGWGHVGNTEKVTGVKGGAESEYRTGGVNVTPSNVLGEAEAQKLSEFTDLLVAQSETDDESIPFWNMDDQLWHWAARNPTLGSLYIPTVSTKIAPTDTYKQAIENLQSQTNPTTLGVIPYTDVTIVIYSIGSSQIIAQYGGFNMINNIVTFKMKLQMSNPTVGSHRFTFTIPRVTTERWPAAGNNSDISFNATSYNLGDGGPSFLSGSMSFPETGSVFEGKIIFSAEAWIVGSVVFDKLFTIETTYVSKPQL